ncbi:hypothetical protein [Actinomadura verrucosospora]|uniref:Secreted protein n=1 Tax=Actinomadura verrucosospora TaxID=46165 RepID=A0A7D4AWZ3_ACTVE|nr:hypothetical protein [Actinomadura verrucosospora]QKG26849.1 hypothetical protein ACTIVE_8502 [Actinomadura verrucosospora]
MITVLVLVSVAALVGLCLLRPAAPPAPDEEPAAPDPASSAPTTEPAAAEPEPAATAEPGGVHPESMTAELDPGDEEYLAFLANELWPEDEYLEPEHTTDGEEESGGSDMLL